MYLEIKSEVGESTETNQAVLMPRTYTCCHARVSLQTEVTKAGNSTQPMYMDPNGMKIREGN